MHLHLQETCLNALVGGQNAFGSASARKSPGHVKSRCINFSTLARKSARNQSHRTLATWRWTAKANGCSWRCSSAQIVAQSRTLLLDHHGGIFAAVQSARFGVYQIRATSRKISRAGSDCLERHFIAANVDLRSFKPVPAVEILIAYNLWSRILSTISGGRTCPQMKVA
jgi:hypothetical protein